MSKAKDLKAAVARELLGVILATCGLEALAGALREADSDQLNDKYRGAYEAWVGFDAAATALEDAVREWREAYS